MEQNSKEWEEWRHNGLGSSDAPVIMGVSKWKTRYQLYLEKIADKPPVNDAKKNFIFEKGHRLEAEARARREIIGDKLFPAKLLQHAQLEWLKASMDGANLDHMEGEEFKYVGKDVFLAGVCPEHYYPQVQEQYIVSGFKKITLVLITDDKELCGSSRFITKEVEVPVDLEYCKKLLAEMMAFWDLVKTKTPPELSDKDATKIKDKELAAKVKRYAALQKKIAKVAAAEKEAEKLKKEIFAVVTHPFMVCGKIKVKYYFKKGSIDYGAIPAVAKMKPEELEAFRKASSKTTTITVG